MISPPASLEAQRSQREDVFVLLPLKGKQTDKAFAFSASGPLNEKEVTIMWRRFLFVGTLSMILSCALFSSTTDARLNWAPCQQWELEGVWDVTVFTPTKCEDCSGESAIKFRRLEIDSAGWIRNRPVIKGEWQKRRIRGGRLFFTPACEIEGYIETSRGTMRVERGGIAGDSLVLDSDLRRERRAYRGGEWIRERVRRR